MDFCTTYLLWIRLVSIIIFQTLNFNFSRNQILIKKQQYFIVSASSDKPAAKFDKTVFKEQLKRSVLLDINSHVDDGPEISIADGYKTNLGHLNKRLKANGRDAIYTACTIGHGLTELKKLYGGNKKLLIFATKDLFSVSYVYFFIDLCDFATTYYSVLHISLPLSTVRNKLKLIKEIVKTRTSGREATK